MNNLLIIYLFYDFVLLRLLLNFLLRFLSRSGVCLLLHISLGHCGGVFYKRWLNSFQFLMLFHICSIDHFQFYILLWDSIWNMWLRWLFYFCLLGYLSNVGLILLYFLRNILLTILILWFGYIRYSLSDLIERLAFSSISLCMSVLRNLNVALCLYG